MTLIPIAIAAFFTTLVGGLIALSLKDRLHLILGFSAGAIVAVTFFDLIPEALELAGGDYDSNAILSVTALGFALYLVFDRLILQHSHLHCAHEENHHHEADKRGPLGAASLAVHSFLDGVGIGLAFHVSPSVGVVVAAAVLTHDFSDGINTVSMIIRHHGKRAIAMRWLIIDAMAPVLGIISTFFFTLTASTLGLLLALFAGFFLYIGATDLIPESHHSHPVRLTTFVTLLGMAVMYTAIKIAGV